MNALEKTKARREKFALYFIGSGVQWTAVLVDNPLPAYCHGHAGTAMGSGCLKCNKGGGQIV